MQIEKYNILDILRECYYCPTKEEILADLELEPTKENLDKLTALLNELKDDGTISVYQRLGDEGKFMGRGYGISEE